MKLKRYTWIGMILICILVIGCSTQTEKPEKHSTHLLPLLERNFYIGMVPGLPPKK
jgi:hypothetical protein